MNELDNQFFEKYKELEKLCSEMYNCRNGVSEYITDMENNSTLLQIYVPSYKDIYKGLKHIRHIRNMISHETMDSFSRPEDLSFVNGFYTSIMNGKDPMTLLRKAMEKAKQPQPDTLTRYNEYTNSQNQYYEPKSRMNKGWLAFAIVMIALMMVFFFALKDELMVIFNV